ncbi:hypothetical protein DFP74_0509 [Nocardiopsis sp. Huas11]|uniref:hypothetical protein n=1 Tax=Nocardiopsis sp. Huas11 TaxID=2183912 RepID=UPI000F288140|nr:hypothetical protein [Nocardiopsis sp. Huas11]RKS04929.1 hypothetical protein DFP74_0509 [Nocardiopsis sp. Huas11]
MNWNSPRGHAEGLVKLFLEDRLNDARNPPGVREAVVQSLVEQVETMKQRCSEQIDQLRTPSSQRIPDAYFNDEEEPENALQQVAAGIRAARARESFLAPDARGFEATYAFALAPSSRWALLQESSRVPRPATRHHRLTRSLTPIPWQDNEDEWPPPTAVDLEGTRRLTGPDADPVRVAENPYSDWVQLGMFERQATFATTHPEQPSRQLLISTGLEVIDGSVPSGSMPAGTNPPNIWLTTYDHLLPGIDQAFAAEILEDFEGPLTALANYQDQRGAPNRDRGVGLHPFTLVPRLEVVAFLDLRPESPTVRHCLVDGQGPALVGRNWRGFLIHDGSYSPLTPAVQGTDLIIRPDQYERLEAALGKDNIQSGIAVRPIEREDNGMY